MENNTLQETVQQTSFNIRNAMRVYGHSDDYITFAAVTYVLYKISMQINPNITYEALMDTLQPNERMFIEDCVGNILKEKALWKDMTNIAMQSVPAVFARILLQPVMANGREYIGDRPESILKLMDNLLDLQDDDNCCETFYGCGDALIYFVNKYNCAFHSMEVDTQLKGIAECRLGLLNKNVKIEQGWFIEKAYNAKAESIKYDKIYSFHPLGLRIGGMYGKNVGDKFLEKAKTIFKKLTLKKSTSFDWAIALTSSLMLKDDGKAVLVVPDGCLFNGSDEQVRRYFIENGLLEAVIALPSKMFMSLGVNVSLLVISKGNKFARLVNARDICQTGRRQNTFSDEDIAKIMDEYKNGGKNTVDVTPGDVQPNMYTLSPERYLAAESLHLNNPVPLEEVVLNIGRPALLSAKELDECTSEEPTDIRFVRLADIQDGIISSRLPYLKDIDSKYERYYLEDGDLILSKMGYPFKVAIAKVEAGEKILPIGNMYVIKVDKDKIDLHYLKAFLESAKGIAVLKSIAVGTSIPVINVAALQKMPVELPDKDIQDKIAKKYQAVTDEIEILKMKLARATEKLSNIMEE